MLFDLQSPRRKRAVQIIFGAMAALLGLSLVLFGIGSGVQGNPLDSILGNSDGDSALEVVEDDIQSEEDKLAENPQDPAPLLRILELRYQAANSQYDADEATGQAIFTPDAEEQLQKAADAWDRYLKVSGGKNPDSSGALIAVQAYAALAQGLIQQASGGSGQEALNTADDSLTNFKLAGQTQLILANAKNGSSAEAARAAEYFYFAGDTQAAEQAKQLAISKAKTPKQAAAVEKQLKATEKQGAALNKQIDDYRKALQKAQSQGGGAGGATGTDTGGLGDLGGGGALGGGGLSGGGLSTP